MLNFVCRRSRRGGEEGIKNNIEKNKRAKRRVTLSGWVAGSLKKIGNLYLTLFSSSLLSTTNFLSLLLYRHKWEEKNWEYFALRGFFREREREGERERMIISAVFKAITVFGVNIYIESTWYFWEREEEKISMAINRFFADWPSRYSLARRVCDV